MQPEQEGGDDAEVASPAADGPEEVGILVRAGAYLLAARENDVGFEQVVDRKPAFAGQMAEAAAQGEATHPRRGDDPTRRREPVLVRGSVHVAPGRAATDPNRARLRIDLDVAHQREIDHDTVVAGSQPSAVVAAAADRKRQVVVASEPHGRHNVIGVRTARDQRRPSVDHGVEDVARFAVLGILWPDQRAIELGQLFTCRACGCGPSAHSVLLIRVCCCREARGRGPLVR